LSGLEISTARPGVSMVRFSDATWWALSSLGCPAL
jgi:hypothetical protein